MDANDLRNQLDRLLKITCEKADRVGAAAWTGAAKAGQAAENAVTCARLRLHNKELEAEVRDRLRAVGELVYATHSGNPRDSADLERLLREIDALRQLAAENRRTMALLRGLQVCAACGASAPGDHVYCEECGRPLDP